MNKNKKIALIVAGIVEIAIVVFVIVVSIIYMATFIPKDSSPYYDGINIEKNGPFIGWLQENPTAFLAVIIPIFLILALDIIYLIMVAVKKESKLSEAEMDAISAQAKKEAREEVLKELKAERNKNKNNSDAE